MRRRGDETCIHVRNAHSPLNELKPKMMENTRRAFERVKGPTRWDSLFFLKAARGIEEPFSNPTRFPPTKLIQINHKEAIKEK